MPHLWSRASSSLMRRGIHAVVLLVVWCALAAQLRAQEETSLGDLARSLRKVQTPPKTIIDNDNLSSVMEDGETKKWALYEPMRRDPIQLVQMSSPDITCALSFSDKPDPLAELQPQNLPDLELAKLDGPATLLGDSLRISVHNGSAWDLREITVSLTIVRQQDAPPPSTQYDAMNLVPTMVRSSPNPENTVGPASERLSDTTLLYHLKGTAAPSATIVLRETLSTPLAPDQEWHWAIVQAKGIPPATAPASGN
jgi:hypothetical protein